MSGYTCALCHAFVPDGVVHLCPNLTQQPQWQHQVPQGGTFTFTDYGSLYLRIAAALEKQPPAPETNEV